MKSIYVLLLVVIGINLSGCVSYYNHNRVSGNLIKEEAIYKNDTQTLRYIASGIEPSKAVKISALSDQDEINGLSVSIDPYEIGGYIKTFKEAPISSTVSILADMVIAYGTYELGKEVSDSISDNRRVDSVNITFGDNVSIITGDPSYNTTIINRPDNSVDNSSL